MVATFIEGFLLGLATGTTCLVTCGPVYAPYLMQYNRSLPGNILAVCELSAGRLITYLLVGATAGMLGRQLTFDGMDFITAAGYLLFSLYLLWTVFRTHKRDQCCSTGRAISISDRPLILGILTGINLCPPFLLALTKAMSGTGPATGMVLFAAFFASTTLFLLPVSAFGLLGSRMAFRSAARWVACAVSIWFIVMAGLHLRTALTS